MQGNHPPTAEGPSLLARYGRDKVFKTNLFGTFVARLVRKHVLLHFDVTVGHPVLEEEERLLRESVAEIRDYLRQSPIKWPVPWRMAKTVVVQYVRMKAKVQVRDHDLDDDAEEAVMESIYREQFEELFPANWFDS